MENYLMKIEDLRFKNKKILVGLANILIGKKNLTNREFDFLVAYLMKGGSLKEVLEYIKNIHSCDSLVHSEINNDIFYQDNKKNLAMENYTKATSLLYLEICYKYDQDLIEKIRNFPSTTILFDRKNLRSIFSIVDAVFLALLRRLPDDEGLHNYTNKIINEAMLDEIIHEVKNSKEYKENGYQIIEV